MRPLSRAIAERDELGCWPVRRTGQQGSAGPNALVHANGLIVAEQERGPVAAGEPVRVLPPAGPV